MAGILDGVDQRTQLAGHNRFELLLFKLAGKQRFGINVFKVQEVIQCPKLTQIPHASSVVCGVAHLRGKTIPVMDLSMAIGMLPISQEKNNYVIVTEYNRSTQGFMVGTVDRIINIGWSEVSAPPKGVGRGNYLTAVTRFDDEMIDVEKIMSEVMGGSEEASEDALATNNMDDNVDDHHHHHVLIVDDSSVARNQVKRVLDQMGIRSTLMEDGAEAWNHLQALQVDGVDISKHYSMIISDVEMPQMDGYTLASKIKADKEMKSVYTQTKSRCRA
jgi:two-component system chemotaxis response regulator CheV